MKRENPLFSSVVPTQSLVYRFLAFHSTTWCAASWRGNVTVADIACTFCQQVGRGYYSFFKGQGKGGSSLTPFASTPNCRDPTRTRRVPDTLCRIQSNNIPTQIINENIIMSRIETITKINSRKKEGTASTTMKNSVKNLQTIDSQVNLSHQRR